MSEKLELALDGLYELAERDTEEYYRIMVLNLTTSTLYAAKYMNPHDLETLSRFIEDVKNLQK